MVAWSSFISHFIYGALAIGTTGFHYDSFAPAHISIGIITFRSLLGMISAVTEEGNENVKKTYEMIDKITWFFAFPFYAAHLWLQYGLAQEYAYIHPVIALIPFGLYLAEKEYQDASSALMLGNALSAGYVTVMQHNWFGLAATAVFAMTHGVIKWDVNLGDNISKEDLFNYMLAIYIILAFHVW